MENLEFDVIICGGGPGGSATALGFVDSDIKVAVIEKSMYPREKVCGDGMAPYIAKALHKMSPRYAEAFTDFKEKIPVNNVKIISYNGQTVIIPFPEPWFISTRYHFDNFLYEQASALPNVTYFTEEQVTNIRVTESGVNVETNKSRTISAKMIIGGDGAASIVRRQLTDYQIDPAYHCVAVRAYYANVEEVPLDTFEIHLISKYPKGYLWVFPSENGNANIGFGMLSEDVIEQKLKLREVLLEIIEQTPYLNKRFKNATLLSDIKGWSIPLGYEKHPISGNRFMLVGDAASIADPASAEGIGQAIVTGRIAASHAKLCFANNDFSVDIMKGYDLAIKQKWGGQNKKRRILSNIFSENQWLLNLLIKCLGSRNFLGRLTLKSLTSIVT
jgi:menaquinone-9 beta-reductase